MSHAVTQYAHVQGKPVAQDRVVAFIASTGLEISDISDIKVGQGL
jgi:hypothetical protein